MSSATTVIRSPFTVDGTEIEVYQSAQERVGLVVCAAHPVDTFGVATVELLASVANTRVVCVNPRRVEPSVLTGPAAFERMVDDIEGVRKQLGCDRWIFWGMSGGGWLAQLYAHRYPDALVAMIVESADPCFRQRLADPGCLLSPYFPAWRTALGERGLLAEGIHDRSVKCEDTEWLTVPDVGEVLRHRDGPALVVSPVPVADEMRSAMPTLLTFDARPWLAELRLPSLVLCGSDDPVLPERHARAVHQAVANSSFFEAEGGGHVPTASGHEGAGHAVKDFLAGDLEGRLRI
ncbi:MAG: alpha/beta hydrolase [Myxococcota bacterium]